MSSKMWLKLKQKIIFWQNPAESQQELMLNRHRIYIIPNRTGLVYTLILLTIFIASINYNLNLGYGLFSVLVSCGWLGINFTFRNLSRTGLAASPSAAVFMGELAHFSVHLNNHSKHVKYAIGIGFSKTSLQMVDIEKFSSHSLTLATPAIQRGRMSCPRILIRTTFPFGLLNAWSYWKTAQTILVYPTPEPNPPPLPYIAEGVSGTELNAGNEELSGVRNYLLGDSLKLLAWRQMARQSASGNDVLISKHFEGGQQKRCTLDFATLPPHLNTEQKLSRMCAWLQEAQRQQVSYAFKLGSVAYPRNLGEDHQTACLTALALYETGQA